MKKVLTKITPFLVLLLALGLVVGSCEKKDPAYDVVITVKYNNQDDTNQVVKGAYVVIEKNDVRVEGMTDAGGQFATTFRLEAILNVHATIDTGTMGIPFPFCGNSTVRLLEDKTVYRTVFVNSCPP